MSTHPIGCPIPDHSCREVRIALLKLARRDDLSERAESFLHNAAFDASPVAFLARSAAGRHVLDVLCRSERTLGTLSISSPHKR